MPYSVIRRTGLLFGCVMMAGCGESVLCPTTVEPTEAVLQIASVTNTVTHDPISQVTISNLKLNGDSVDLSTVANFPTTKNVTVVGSSLVCAVSCGFAVQPGTYSFTVSATGLTPTQVIVLAQYSSRSKEVCSQPSGGTKVQLTLAP